MKRQISCIILTFALLVSMLSVGFALPAAADVTATTIFASDNVVIAPEDNILKGATCSESAFTQSQLYDGLVKNATVNLKEASMAGIDGDYLWVTYTLAASTDVESVLIAGSTANRDGGLGMQGFAVYVGDKDAAAIKAEASVQPQYEVTERVYNGVQINFATPIRATYVVFKIGVHRDATWNGNVWVSELAATGKAPYTVTNITASSNTDKVIAAEDNILASANCSDSTLTPTAAAGVYNGVVDDNKWNRKVPYIEGAVGTDMWITYTLAAATDVESVLFGGSGATRNGIGLGFDGCSVYVGDADAAAIQADSSIQPVYSTTDNIQNARRVDFAKSVRGTKIVFRLGIVQHEVWLGNVWISELAATGTAPYTVTNITASSNTDKVIAAEDNILASANCSDSTLTPTAAAGVYNGVVDDNKWNRKVPYIEGAVGTDMWITYTLAATTDVESVLFGGSGATRNGIGLGFDGCSVYVGDADAAAIQADSSIQPVYSTTDNIQNARRVDFAKSVRGTKIVFRLGIIQHEVWLGNVWISELAATGDAPYTVTNITASSNTDKVIAEKDNLLISANCSDSTLAPTVATGVYNGVVDDGKWNRKVPYIEGAVGTDMWVTYTLPAKATVDAVLVGGSGAVRNGLGLGFMGYSVYIGDEDAAAIQADSSIQPVYTTADNIQNARRVDFTESAEGTKIVLRLGIHQQEAWLGNVWISELAAIGYIPYSTVEISPSLNTDKMIGTADNLLASATCSDSYLTAAGLYNGTLSDGAYYQEERYMNERTADHKWVTYTLPAEYEISSFLVAGSGAIRDGLGLGFTGFAVYIGDKTAQEIWADSSIKPAYETTDQMCNARRVTLTTPVKGTKIVFKFGIHREEAWNGRIWMSELAAMGEPIVKERYNVVCIGDSITWGCTAASAGAQVETPYPAHLQTMLNAIDPTVQYTVTNLGLSGASVVDGSLIGKDTIKSWLNAKWTNNATTQAKVADADYVFIMLGTNDCPNWDNGRRDLYKQEYKKLIDTIYGANADAKIYIVTSPAALKETYYSTLANDIVPMQLELAAELGLPVADAYNATRDYIRDEGEAAFIVSTEIDGLRIHPDSEGLGVIAAACVTAFKGEAHVSELKASATADADVNTNFEGVTGGVAAGAAHDANRVTPLNHNLVAKNGTVITGADAIVADGKLTGVNTTAANATAANLTVDFGTTATITQILLGGCTSAVQVYVTDDVDALGEAVVTLDATAAAGRIVTLTAPVAGRYLVAKAAADAQLSELAAVGCRSDLVTMGAQIRDTAADGSTALRFGFDLYADGVKYADAETYTRDIADATYTVEGVAYKLVDFGAVMSPSADSDLALEDVDAGEVITKQVAADKLYSVDGGKVRFTAVVVKIPADQSATTIYARPYVTYFDGTKNVTVYGDRFSACADDYK